MSTGDNYLRWKQRAEQAENELRALKLSHERLRKECMDAEARAERAEADNAALLNVLRRFRERPPPETHPHSAQAFMRWHMDNERAADEVLAAAHPGAALLERLSAAQSELDALRVAVNATPSGAERIHAMLVAAGIPEEDEVSGVLGLEEHVGRTLERLGVATAYAATGLREHHGHRCGMAGGPHPDNPRECNDAHCRQWAHDLDALKERKP
jgi:hypothetical protein